ncbi:MAG: alpha/beta fold hydrolase [Sulfitobacter sp.]|nr:alpha/beta fold hydrolase [Sulfitobacter sp.]
MAVISLTAGPEAGRTRVADTGEDPTPTICSAARGQGPIVIALHGYKYLPGSARHCPHRSLLSPDAPGGWPRALRTLDGGAEGLFISFGWHARGPLRRVFARAAALAPDLAGLISLLQEAAPHRKVHLIGHSLGAELALQALALAPADSVGRVILLSAASHDVTARAALCSPAGRVAELINVTSAENDLFDLMFEWLVPAPRARARALGRGFEAPNAVTLALDCPRTLEGLARIGAPVPPPQRRICHWSSYARPGVLGLYARCLDSRRTLTLDHLRLSGPRAPVRPWRVGFRAVIGKMLGTPSTRPDYEHAH